MQYFNHCAPYIVLCRVYLQAAVDAAVKELLELKAQYKTVTGNDWKPAGGQDGGRAKKEAKPKQEKPKQEKPKQDKKVQ